MTHNFIFKIPKKYIDELEADIKESNIEELNKYITNYFREKKLFFPEYYFHSGWNKNNSRTLEEFFKINKMVWTETIYDTPSFSFWHNFRDMFFIKKVQIFKLTNSAFCNDTRNIRIWDYQKFEDKEYDIDKQYRVLPVSVKDHTWIPVNENLIIPVKEQKNNNSPNTIPMSRYIPNKQFIYLRKNALKQGVDCAILFNEAAIKGDIIHYGEIQFEVSDDDEISVIYNIQSGGKNKSKNTNKSNKSNKSKKTKKQKKQIKKFL
jgi:hypothetical protein